MLKTFVEEAAALTSLVLFVGMIAIWRRLFPRCKGPVPGMAGGWG